LFDTFEGFNERDFQHEQEAIDTAVNGYLGNTSEAEVLAKLPYPDLCVLKKGYFPESAADTSGNFCFVNLDMDLYKPTLDGVRFFYPKMSPGGVIVVHDFYNPGYPNIKKAVFEFYEEMKGQIKLFPIGDDMSIAIIK
jgi:hypothetical protein